MRKAITPLLVIFVILWIASLAGVPASASGNNGTGIFVTVNLPETKAYDLWRFDFHPPTISGTQIGTYSRPAFAQDFEKPTLKISPDGKWIASAWINAEPPLTLELGRIGDKLTQVNAPGKSLDAILEFSFSPDSHYFTYTLYTDAWTFGIVDLQSGKKAEFSDHAVTMPPAIDVRAPFGKMIPVVASWSSDHQTVYFETYLMLGCRGPHALYAATVADLLRNTGSTSHLPPTTLISPAGADVFSYGFSPDGAYVAYAMDDQDCGVPTQLGVTTLQTNQSRTAVQASTGRAVLVLGWLADNKTILFSSDPAPEGDSGPTFPIKSPRVLHISRAAGGPDKIADLTSSPDEAVANLAVTSNNLFYTVVADTESDTSARTLYMRPISGTAPTAIAQAQSDHEIYIQQCQDTLYFTTQESDGMKLWRVLPGQTTPEIVLGAPHIAFAGCAS